MSRKNKRLKEMPVGKYVKYDIFFGYPSIGNYVIFNISCRDFLGKYIKSDIIFERCQEIDVTFDEQMDKIVGNGGGIGTSINQILKKLLPEWETDQIERTWQDLYEAKIHRTPGTNTILTDQGIKQLENRLDKFGRKVANYLENSVHKRG